MSIAQNIKEQESLILQSPVFKSVRPANLPVKIPTSIEIESMKIRELFDEQNSKIRLAIFICPWRLYKDLRSYRNWIEKLRKTNDESLSNDFLLRVRNFTRTNDDQYWKTCLQAYFTDINQIYCPYELQGACKAQNCLFQHQFQINQRIEEYLTTKKVQQSSIEEKHRFRFRFRFRFRGVFKSRWFKICSTI